MMGFKKKVHLTVCLFCALSRRKFLPVKGLDKELNLQIIKIFFSYTALLC